MSEKKIKAEKKVEIVDAEHDHDHEGCNHDHGGHHHSHESTPKPTLGETLNVGDFVQINYSGYLKEDNTLFDTTIRQVAQNAGIFKDNVAYGPITIKLGRGQILKGIDSALIGKKAGDSIKLELGCDQAFGRKDAKLIQLVATSKFIKQRINPFPGLSVNIDGMNGIIRTVTGGRTIVDFNHPLSNKDVKYEIEVVKKVVDENEQIKSYLEMQMNLPVEVSEENGKKVVKTKQEVPKELHEMIAHAIKENVSDKLTIEFQKL